jgi:hypothetical protein
LLALAPLAARAAEPVSLPVVGCDSIILRVRSGHEGGDRVVLGVVAVPPAFLHQVERMRTGPWTTWRKAGLAVRGNAGPVFVRVPKAWRKRAAITWGDSGIVSALRIAPCRPFLPPKVWNAYAGGFYLRSRTACVPLVFRVGQRQKTVRFGLGRRC